MNSKTEEKILNLISEQLGVEKEDLKLEDSFVEDLHMSAGDLADFLALLEEEGINLGDFDSSEVETLGDLIEAATSKEDIR